MKLTIDGQPTVVNDGTTILEAARALGIEIPTLCHQPGLSPQTSCFLCVVQVQGNDNFLPACATPAAEGMVVSTRSPEVTATRKTALELLFSDHAGCCIATCTMACPADLDIPGFTEPLAAGRTREAIAVIKERLPLPAVLGRICPAYCESACMRKRLDESIAVHSLHRLAADLDLASPDPYQPEKKPASGKRVAIVGAGPAGLSAAYYLLQQGHACTLFDAAERPGGLLRHLPAERLDQSVLDAEIAVIHRLGAEFTPNWKLGRDGSLAELRSGFDAVLLAFGAALDPLSEQRKVDLEFVKAQGLAAARKGIEADRQSQATAIQGVFAAGEALLGASHAVFAVASGRGAALSIDQYLAARPVTGAPKPFYFWRKQQTAEENETLYGRAGNAPCALSEAARLPGAAPSAAADSAAPQVALEAGRCLQCGCDKADSCRLRRYATQYNIQPNRFRGERRTLAPDDSHAELLYEPGKCILCGLCLRLAETQGEALGLAFVGRGFPTRVAVPLEGKLSEGITKNAHLYAQACPSGALSLK